MHCKFLTWINFKKENKSIQTHKKYVWMAWNNTLTGLTTRMHSYWWLMQASDSLCFMCVSNRTQKDVMMTELGHPTICPWLRTNSQTHTHTNISFISKRKPQGSLIYFWLITVRSLNEAPSCVWGLTWIPCPYTVSAGEWGWLPAMTLLVWCWQLPLFWGIDHITSVWPVHCWQSKKSFCFIPDSLIWDTPQTLLIPQINENAWFKN